MELLNYSDKSIVLIGEKTRTYKEDIKKMNGKYNANLKNSEGEKISGWVFHVSQEETLKQFVEMLNSTMRLVKYSDNCIVLTGEKTRYYKDEIKKMNGKYNANLKDDKGDKYSGWVFHVSQEEALKKFIEDKN